MAPSPDCRQNPNCTADLATRGLDRSPREPELDLVNYYARPFGLPGLRYQTQARPSCPRGISLQYKTMVSQSQSLQRYPVAV